jgi:hypothetical protein
MQRISKRQAFKRFVAGQKIILCPVKLRPGFPFAPQITLSPETIQAYKARAEYYSPDLLHRGDSANMIWQGSIEKTAWHLMYTEWAFHNTSYEAGYYAAYYVEK